MLLRTSIQKTKNFFQTTLHNLRSFLFGGYRKNPKLLLFNPLSWGNNRKKQQTDRYYADFYSEWDFNLVQEEKRKRNVSIPSEEPVREEEAHGGSFRASQSTERKNKQENGEEERKNKGSSNRFKREEQCNQIANGGSYTLAQKMKALEMMDVSDVEHVLDVEEALHYYSRLKSPVYIDIVDKFFVDMNSEFSVPQASANINNSERRLGSIRF